MIQPGLRRLSLRRRGNPGSGGAEVSSATPLAIGTAAAGVSEDAARADHVHPIGVADGSLVKMAAGVPAAAVPGTDFLAGDVIDRQTLGAPAQEVTFVVDGNADEVIEIEGVGSVMSGSLTMRFNDNATPLTYRGIYSEDGGAAPESTYLGTYLGAVGGFTIKVFAKTGSRRGGFSRNWSERASDGLQQQVIAVFRWANTTDNITSIKVRISEVGGFPAGFIIVARRRKITA